MTGLDSCHHRFKWFLKWSASNEVRGRPAVVARIPPHQQQQQLMKTEDGERESDDGNKDDRFIKAIKRRKVETPSETAVAQHTTDTRRQYCRSPADRTTDRPIDRPTDHDDFEPSPSASLTSRHVTVYHSAVDHTV